MRAISKALRTTTTLHQATGGADHDLKNGVPKNRSFVRAPHVRRISGTESANCSSITGLRASGIHRSSLTRRPKVHPRRHRRKPQIPPSSVGCSRSCVASRDHDQCRQDRCAQRRDTNPQNRVVNQTTGVTSPCERGMARLESRRGATSRATGNIALQPDRLVV